MHMTKYEGFILKENINIYINIFLWTRKNFYIFVENLEKKKHQIIA